MDSANTVTHPQGEQGAAPEGNINEFGQVIGAKVAAPILADDKDKKPPPFFKEMKDDPSIKKFGKFHIGQRTFWWAISSLGFGTTILSDTPGALPVSRLTYLEFSQLQEGMRIIKRLIVGRLIVYYA